MGFRKADDFYIALGGAKISAKVVTQKVMARLRAGESAVEPAGAVADLEAARRRPPSPPARRRATASWSTASTT